MKWRSELAFTSFSYLNNTKFHSLVWKLFFEAALQMWSPPCFKAIHYKEHFGLTFETLVQRPTGIRKFSELFTWKWIKFSLSHPAKWQIKHFFPFLIRFAGNELKFPVVIQKCKVEKKMTQLSILSTYLWKR